MRAIIGAWTRSISHLAIVPSLVLTLLFGPLGLVSYLAIRLATRRRITLVEG